MRSLVLVLLVVMLAAGCTARVDTPDLEVRTTPGRVVIGDAPSSGHGRFCPPGQAKKGNC